MESCAQAGPNTCCSARAGCARRRSCRGLMPHAAIVANGQATEATFAAGEECAAPPCTSKIGVSR